MDISLSIVVPVYNRLDETKELLESMANQTNLDFEVIIIEDGSDMKCEEVINKFKDKLKLKYYFKENTGPGLSRNYGVEQASGNYIIFLDSDCILPPKYISIIKSKLLISYTDAFGGPDKADDSFTNLQKAIDYSMTSIITTGGVRRTKNKLDKYQPRSFNMGISRQVYETVGGFSNIHPGEDPELSYKIMDAGFRIELIKDAYVYHKRRIDFKKFAKQVYKFGVVRFILIKWYPNKFKIVYLFPSLFLLISFLFIILSILINPIWITILIFISIIIFIESLIKYKNISISFLSIIASFIQLYSYGYGFLKSGFSLLVLKRKERKEFSSFFYGKNN